jgi:hypothetical protein
MFLALTLAAFLAVRRDRLFLAGVAGYLAALTRPVGVFLVLPLALAYWKERRDRRQPLEFRGAWLALVPLGLATFAAYNYVLAGNALAFVRIQTSWGHTFHTPLTVLARGLGDAEVNARFSAWIRSSSPGSGSGGASTRSSRQASPSCRASSWCSGRTASSSSCDGGAPRRRRENLHLSLPISLQASS